MWLLVKMKRLVVAPYYPVEFADFWLADQLNSLAAVVMDLEYLVCFFSFDGNFKDGSSKHHKIHHNILDDKKSIIGDAALN